MTTQQARADALVPKVQQHAQVVPPRCVTGVTVCHQAHDKVTLRSRGIGHFAAREPDAIDPNHVSDLEPRVFHLAVKFARGAFIVV